MHNKEHLFTQYWLTAPIIDKRGIFTDKIYYYK